MLRMLKYAVSISYFSNFVSQFRVETTKNYSNHVCDLEYTV